LYEPGSGEKGNVDTTEATFTTSTSIVTGNVKEKVLAVLNKASDVPVFTSYWEQIDDILEKAEKNSNITLSVLATIPVLLFTLLFSLCFGRKKSALTTETIKKEDLVTADEVATFPGNVDETPVEVNPEGISHTTIGEAGEESTELEPVCIPVCIPVNDITDRSLEINSEDASEAATALPSNEDASPEHPAERPSEIADSKTVEISVDSEGPVPEVDHQGVEPTTIVEADKGTTEPEPLVKYYFCVPLCAAWAALGLQR
jgi:hypothetical protein